MGADIKSLRSRIKSVDSTLHLTKAMGLVASSKMRRATEAMLRGREYSSAVREAVGLLCSAPECAKSPYMQQREGGRQRIIVIAGDRGLAGGYNVNVFRLADSFAGADITPIGRRACERYGKAGPSSEHFTSADAADISKKLCEDFAGGEYDGLGIISTEYVSMLTQNAKLEWILPLKRDGGKKRGGVIFEPDEITILNAAVTEYVSGLLTAAVRESFACETAARRAAMDSAGKNAGQMISDLQLAYNRARQGAITQEITEIIAGSGS